jgi:hypothetical protein
MAIYFPHSGEASACLYGQDLRKPARAVEQANCVSPDRIRTSPSWLHHLGLMRAAQRWSAANLAGRLWQMAPQYLQAAFPLVPKGRMGELASGMHGSAWFTKCFHKRHLCQGPRLRGWQLSRTRSTGSLARLAVKQNKKHWIARAVDLAPRSMRSRWLG